MDTYQRVFAYVYDARWSYFARQAAPRLHAYYLTTAHGQAGQPVLDVACGTGQLARYFLEQGLSVTGIDLSPAMLALARENNADFVEAGRARFVEADAADFVLDGRFGLAVSTFDALNHLPDLPALRRCFRAVARALLPGAAFIFDLNTRLGFQRWNSLSVQDGDEGTVVQRGVFDGVGDRAYFKVSGFWRMPNGQVERFDETLASTVFDIHSVLHALIEDGWHSAYAARPEDLQAPLAEPEAEGRVAIVARRPERPAR